MRNKRVKWLRRLWLAGGRPLSFKKFKSLYMKLKSEGKELVMEKE